MLLKIYSPHRIDGDKASPRELDCFNFPWYRVNCSVSNANKMVFSSAMPFQKGQHSRKRPQKRHAATQNNRLLLNILWPNALSSWGTSGFYINQQQMQLTSEMRLKLAHLCASTPLFVRTINASYFLWIKIKVIQSKRYIGCTTKICASDRIRKGIISI